MAHVSDKVKVNMLLLWCGPDSEDIYEGFNIDVPPWWPGSSLKIIKVNSYVRDNFI